MCLSMIHPQAIPCVFFKYLKSVENLILDRVVDRVG
jgi:hypothetical protein